MRMWKRNLLITVLFSSSLHRVGWVVCARCVVSIVQGPAIGVVNVRES